MLNRLFQIHRHWAVDGYHICKTPGGLANSLPDTRRCIVRQMDHQFARCSRHANHGKSASDEALVERENVHRPPRWALDSNVFHGHTSNRNKRGYFSSPVAPSTFICAATATFPGVMPVTA